MWHEFVDWGFKAVLFYCRFLLNKTIDVVLYIDRLDGYRVDNLDKLVIRALAGSFGPNFWRLGMIVLTHAQLSPPDGGEYSEFVEKRSAALQAAIRQEAGLKKSEKEVRKRFWCACQLSSHSHVRKQKVLPCTNMQPNWWWIRSAFNELDCFFCDWVKQVVGDVYTSWLMK
jgi:hypothetical protein